MRGGFPDSFLSRSDRQSGTWRRHFIRTYLARDIPQFGPRVPAETLRRFWVMLAHLHGGLLNAAGLARSLGVDNKTVRAYLDLMVDLLLVRRLPPWSGNVGKRLVKSPKVYIRDSGLLHTLLQIGAFESLLGNPKYGDSWEGFVIENLLSMLSDVKCGTAGLVLKTFIATQFQVQGQRNDKISFCWLNECFHLFAKDTLTL